MKPCAIIDPRLSETIKKNLDNAGFFTISVPLSHLVDTPLSGHPDIQLFLHEKNLFVQPDIDNSFLHKIDRYVNIIQCTTRLKRSYPDDTPYNIACTGTIAIHKNDSTDKCILEYFLQNKINIINTRQGYSKCSTLIVDESSIITADKSIHNAAMSAGIDSLLITHGHVDLPGYNYGFIGGASGKFRNTIYLTGRINHHPDAVRIRSFIESRGLNLIFLSDQKIFDSGSIFFIE